MILQWKEKPNVITVGTPWSNDVLLNQIISTMVCRSWLRNGSSSMWWTKWHVPMKFYQLWEGFIHIHNGTNSGNSQADAATREWWSAVNVWFPYTVFSRKGTEKFTCGQPLNHVTVLESRGNDSTILTPETALPYQTTEPSVHFGFEYHFLPVGSKRNSAICEGNN